MAKKIKDVTDVIERVNLPSVDRLEELSKVGFFVERQQKADVLQPLYRLGCESKDGLADPDYLTPWCCAYDLQTMIDGCLFLNPLIMKVIRDRQANAEKPVE